MHPTSTGAPAELFLRGGGRTCGQLLSVTDLGQNMFRDEHVQVFYYIYTSTYFLGYFNSILE